MTSNIVMVNQVPFIHVNRAVVRSITMMRLSSRRLVHVHMPCTSTENSIRLIVRKPIDILVEFFSNALQVIARLTLLASLFKQLKEYLDSN